MANANNSYGAISDIRVKNLYHRMESVIDRYRDLELWDYRFKTDQPAAPLRHGVIAQYVEKQFPWLVTEGPWGPGKSAPIRKSVDYMGLSIVTARATQENIARVDDQQEKLQKLEGEVRALSSEVSTLKHFTAIQTAEIEKLRDRPGEKLIRVSLQAFKH